MKLILNSWIPKNGISATQTLSLDSEEQNNEDLIRLCDIIYDRLLNRYTSSDEEVMICYNLAQKMNELKYTEEPEEVEFSDIEYYYIHESLHDERLLIKAQFLQMVDALNPIEDSISESDINVIPIEEVSNDESVNEESNEELY